MSAQPIPDHPGWAWERGTFYRDAGSLHLEVRWRARSGHRWSISRAGRELAGGYAYTGREGMDKAERHLTIQEETR